MFKLIFREINEEVIIYNVRNDNCGFPMFLIYIKDVWVWKSAKYFKPLGKE